MVIAASGMRARMESLEMLANNLANAATTGYKSDREFYSIYVAPEAMDTSAPNPNSVPMIERHWTDHSQGTLSATGNPLDFGISGKGFFAVDGPGRALYTRNGSFRISAAGILTTHDGYAVRSAAGTPIQISASAPIEVTPDGVIRQNGQDAGQIAVMDFDSQVALTKTGHNYFRPADPAMAPKETSAYELRQGHVEASNVSAPEAAVRLISVMRQFEMLQKAMNIGGEMGRRAIEEVARVNP